MERPASNGCEQWMRAMGCKPLARRSAGRAVAQGEQHTLPSHQRWADRRPTRLDGWMRRWRICQIPLAAKIVYNGSSFGSKSAFEGASNLARNSDLARTRRETGERID